MAAEDHTDSLVMQCKKLLAGTSLGFLKLKYHSVLLSYFKSAACFKAFEKIKHGNPLKLFK